MRNNTLNSMIAVCSTLTGLVWAYRSRGWGDDFSPVMIFGLVMIISLLINFTVSVFTTAHFGFIAGVLSLAISYHSDYLKQSEHTKEIVSYALDHLPRNSSDLVYEINVKTASKNPRSTLNRIRSMIEESWENYDAVRPETKKYGSWKQYDPDNFSSSWNRFEYWFVAKAENNTEYLSDYPEPPMPKYLGSMDEAQAGKYDTEQRRAYEQSVGIIEPKDVHHSAFETECINRVKAWEKANPIDAKDIQKNYSAMSKIVDNTRAEWIKLGKNVD